MIGAIISYSSSCKLLFRIITLIYFSISSIVIIAQSNDCNKLGAWLWRLEQTGIPSYEELADSLYKVGIKRIYIKVADGQLDTLSWPAIIDTGVISSFHNRDMEVYAWSYNYPGNNERQAEALYTAINTGYDGYIVDIEMEFDNESIILENLVSAFADQKQLAISENLIDSSFVFGVSTWGNPAIHNFRIDILDRYVDAYFPQTYLEVWGESYLDNPAYWVEVGNREYRELGATKPIHHIISTEYNIISADQLNAFMTYAGPETSIWRIPGGSTTYAIWQDWVLVDWDYEFCELTETHEEQDYKVSLYPNPVSNSLQVKISKTNTSFHYHIVDMLGREVLNGISDSSNPINVQNLEVGFYGIVILLGEQKFSNRFIKV